MSTAIQPLVAPQSGVLTLIRDYAELTKLRVKQLSATTTLASGIAVRYKASGQELERVGVTYLLQKADNGWKIAVVVVHDADSVPRAE